MKRGIRYLAALMTIIIIIQCLCCCRRIKHSTFSIVFIDVGQGDSALVECDGNYMLIDGGGVSAGEKVKNTLVKYNVRYLDFLVISHMHQDHTGGIPKALEYASVRGKVLSNTTDIGSIADDLNSDIIAQKPKEPNLIIASDEKDSNPQVLILDEFKKMNLNITVPRVGDVYRLGSARIEVVDVSNVENNDSLVILITYGNTRFLFTGDIEYSGQKRLVDRYAAGRDAEFNLDVIKMPHHGSWGKSVGVNDNDLNRLITAFDPEYAVISVGKGNRYGHPHKETLELLQQAEVEVFRTDINGDIIVRSNGRKVTIETEKTQG